MTQHEFLDLSRERLRQFAEHHRLGAFAMGQVVAAEGDDHVFSTVYLRYWIVNAQQKMILFRRSVDNPRLPLARIN